MFGGRYWAHLHTVYTDGRSSVAEYFEAAAALGIERLIFLEHVRETPTYDPAELERDVRTCAARFGVGGFVGYEAKILPGGRLDIADSLLRDAAVIGVAEHGYPGRVSDMVADFSALVEWLTKNYPRQTFIWAHPGSWLRRSGDPAWRRAYSRMMGEARRTGFHIERNLKYGLVSKEEAHLVGGRVVIGLDAHSVTEARTRWEMLA